VTIKVDANLVLGLMSIFNTFLEKLYNNVSLIFNDVFSTKAYGVVYI
jgi:hypothetical protein